MSLGGFSSIRGFRESTIFGNNGLFARNEIAWDLPQIPSSDLRSYLGKISVYGALDLGRVYGQSDFGIVTGDIMGWAAGVRTRGGRLTFELSYGEVIEAPDNFSQDNSIIYATAGVSF